MNPLTAGFLGKNRLEVSAPRACFCTEGHCGTLRALSPSALCRCPHSGPTEYPTRTAEDLQRVSLHDQGFPKAVSRPLIRTTGLLRQHRVQEPSLCDPSEPHGSPYDVTGVFRTVDSSLQRGIPFFLSPVSVEETRMSTLNRGQLSDAGDLQHRLVRPALRPPLLACLLWCCHPPSPPCPRAKDWVGALSSENTWKCPEILWVVTTGMQVLLFQGENNGQRPGTCKHLAHWCPPRGVAGPECPQGRLHTVC